MKGIIYCLHHPFYEKYTKDNKKLYKLGYSCSPNTRFLFYEEFFDSPIELLYYKYTDYPRLIEKLVFIELNSYRYGNGEFFLCELEIIKKVFDDTILMSENSTEQQLKEQCKTKKIQRSRKKQTANISIDDSEIKSSESSDITTKLNTEEKEYIDIAQNIVDQNINKFYGKVIIGDEKLLYDTKSDIFCNKSIIYGNENNIIGCSNIIYSNNNHVYSNNNIIYGSGNIIFGLYNIIKNQNNTIKT